ncbi:hypothetical protein CBR_g50767 [Chara braunii]|uniref:Uncharacterized protein n=1 Tax=Chara braunii TaxID=69332 RepID=A0A388K5W5_CHABU|nr:hypothetical protein CBR_g50767 [Chara braunii]|eukprot:GBG65406.1 hypothetical protein CBR_g50767 [Chara braunii]
MLSGPGLALMGKESNSNSSGDVQTTNTTTAAAMTRPLRLRFSGKLATPMFTCSVLEGAEGNRISVSVLDTMTDQVIGIGPEASLKVEVVVLEGDFVHQEKDSWTADEFESCMVKERDGKRPLLLGDTRMTLKAGVGILKDLAFSDNSSWVRSRKFRLGVRVSPGTVPAGVRVQEAVSEPFSVRDNRGELYKKHYPPALDDEIWRLEGIGKGGAFDRRLQSCGVHNVEDLLRTFVLDPRKLRKVRGIRVAFCFVVLLWCDWGPIVVLLGCYCGAIDVLLWCY